MPPTDVSFESFDVDDAELATMMERISRLCENIAAGAQECANPEHLNRIAGSLECIFMAGHDDIDYEDESGERRPDA
jgi:hypothetical protein